jgi:hypothetical protein
MANPSSVVYIHSLAQHFTHNSIALTLFPLPLDLVLDPAKWTTLIWGNVGITFGLFIVR